MANNFDGFNTSIKFINHASVIIKGNDVSILTDPWYQDHAFHKGWKLLHETSNHEVSNILDNITHIWISHEHPDHFSIKFFKTFKEKIIENSIKILFQKTDDKRVLNFLKNMGFLVEELEFKKEIFLSDEFSVTCLKDGFYDSALFVKNKNEKILNLNDCEINTKNRAMELFSLTGEVDILLTQFSYAGWKGGKENKKWRKDGAKEKIDTMNLQVSIFKPKFTIPFASFIYFSNEDNFYLNDSINKPSYVLDYFSAKESQIILMKPNDEFKGYFDKTKQNSALSFWEEKYGLINTYKLQKYDKIALNDIEKNFEKYCIRIAKKNNMSLIRCLKFLSPISIFKPVIVKLTDLKCTLKFDYVSKKLSTSNENAMLSMKSESLNFLFINSFGFDTLTVNGCFEEERKSGFVLATKTLAIENLNNLGINIEIKTLFKFSIIKLFLTRLYRVARKLN